MRRPRLPKYHDTSGLLRKILEVGRIEIMRLIYFHFQGLHISRLHSLAVFFFPGIQLRRFGLALWSAPSISLKSATDMVHLEAVLKELEGKHGSLLIVIEGLHRSIGSLDINI